MAYVTADSLAALEGNIDLLKSYGDFWYTGGGRKGGVSC